jgi:hypothetical protein
MGRGTIGMNTVPIKKKIYGDEHFFIFPIYKGKNRKGENEYFIILRPSKNEDYLFELEGEWNCGEKQLKNERKIARSREYKNTKFVYLESDLEDMTFMQRKRILRWAEGEL